MTNKAIRHITHPKDLHQISSNDLTVIITTAKFANRTKHLGSHSLFPIHNISLIEYQINTIRECYKTADIIITVGFEANKIYNLLKPKLSPKLHLVYNPQFEETNDVLNINLACYNNVFSGNLLIIYGNILFDHNTINGINTISQMVIDSKQRLKDDTVGIITENNIVTNLAYGVSPKWGHIVYLTNNEYRLFEQIIFRNDINKLHGHELLNRVIDKGGNFKTIEYHDTVLKEVILPQDLL